MSDLLLVYWGIDGNVNYRYSVLSIRDWNEGFMMAVNEKIIKEGD